MPISQLKEIVEELTQNGISRIWITCLREDYLNEFEMFEYVSAGRIDLRSNLASIFCLGS